MLRILLVIDDYGEMVYLQTLLKKLGFDVDSVQSQRAFSGKLLGFNPQLIITTADGRRVNGIEIAENLRRRKGYPKVLLVLNSEQARSLQLSDLQNVDGTLESPVNVQNLLSLVAQAAGLDSAGLMEKYSRMRSNLQPDEDGDLTLLKGDRESEAGPTLKSEQNNDPKETSPPPRDQQGSSQDLDRESQNSNGDDPIDALEREFSSAEDLVRETQELRGMVEENFVSEGAKRESPSEAHQSVSETSALGLSSEVREARFKKYLEELPPPTQNGFSRELVMQINLALRKMEDEEALRDLEEERRGFVRSLFAGKRNAG